MITFSATDTGRLLSPTSVFPTHFTYGFTYLTDTNCFHISSLLPRSHCLEDQVELYAETGASMYLRDKTTRTGASTGSSCRRWSGPCWRRPRRCARFSLPKRRATGTPPPPPPPLLLLPLRSLLQCAATCGAVASPMASTAAAAAALRPGRIAVSRHHQPKRCRCGRAHCGGQCASGAGAALRAMVRQQQLQQQQRQQRQAKAAAMWWWWWWWWQQRAEARRRRRACATRLAH